MKVALKLFQRIFLLLLIMASVSSDAQIVVSPSRGEILEPVEYFETADGGYIGLDKIPRSPYGWNWSKFHYGLYVSLFDGKMNNKGQLNITNNGEDYSGLFACMARSGNKFYVICLDVTKNGNIGNVRSIEIDPLNLKTLDNNLMIAENDIDMNVEVFSFGRLMFISSPDSKKHCIFIANTKKEFFLSGLDENLKPLWKGKFEIPKIKPFEMKDIDIDNEGNVFITSIDKDNTVYVSRYDPTGKNLISELTMPEGKINNASVLAKKNSNEIFIAGTYSENSKFSNGVFNAILDKNTLGLKDVHKEIFPETIVDRLHKDGFARGKSSAYGLFQAYVFGNLFENGDGTMSYVIECVHPLGQNGFQKAAGSLVITTMTGSANIYSHIPRYEVTAFRGDEKKYYAGSCGKKFYLFYFDHEENLKKDVSEEQKVYQGKNGVLTAATINEGKVTRSAVLDIGGLWKNIKYYLIEACKK